MHNKLKIIFLASLVLFAAGCSSVKILPTDIGPDFLLSNYKSYDFFQIDAEIDPFPEFDKRIGWIKEELKNQLELKGLNQTKENPDLLINIGIVIEEKIQTRETDFRTDAPRYMGTRNYSWKSEEIEVRRYNKGTVTVDIISAENKVLEWQGVAQGVIVKKDEASKKNIAVGAQKMFENIE